MDITSLWIKCCLYLPIKGRACVCVHHAKTSIKMSQLFTIAIASILLFVGCATPHVKPVDPQILFKTEFLAFIQDDVTTREEVLVKLGIPTAQFEGEKILMYQLRANEAGKWHLLAPSINSTTGFRTWPSGAASLVLVFREDGILRRHSLVTAQ